MNVFTEKVNKQIITFLNEENLRRSLPSVTMFDDGKLSIESEPFQTLPVIYKSLKILTQSIHVSPNVINDVTIYDVRITMDTRVEYFDGGNNGVYLYTMNLRILPEDDVRLMSINY